MWTHLAGSALGTDYMKGGPCAEYLLHIRIEYRPFLRPGPRVGDSATFSECSHCQNNRRCRPESTDYNWAEHAVARSLRILHFNLSPTRSYSNQSLQLHTLAPIAVLHTKAALSAVRPSLRALIEWIQSCRICLLARSSQLIAAKPTNLVRHCTVFYEYRVMFQPNESRCYSCISRRLI